MVAAIPVVVFTVVCAGSVIHVLAGCLPLPPSTTSTSHGGELGGGGGGGELGGAGGVGGGTGGEGGDGGDGIDGGGAGGSQYVEDHASLELWPQPVFAQTSSPPSVLSSANVHSRLPFPRAAHSASASRNGTASPPNVPVTGASK